MPFLRKPFSLPGLLLVLFSVACGNGPARQPDPAVEANPAYAGLNDSIRLFPEDASLYLRRALRLSLSNAHELAYPDYRKAWSLHPSVETALPYASNLQILGRTAERLALLKSCAAKFPGNQQLQLQLADAYSGNGSQELALKQYQGILAGNPKDFEAWYEQGLLQEQMRDTAGAISSLQKAYALQAVNTYGLELAHLYAEQKNALALAICDRILERDSASQLIDPLFIKGIYYSNMKWYPKAIAQFDSCIQRDWKTADAYLEKGIAFYRMRNYPSAINTFNMAATVSNTEPDAYYWLGRCYEATNRKENAISNYQKALSLDKSFSDARDAIDRIRKGK